MSMVAIVAGGGAILASAGTEYFKADGPRPFWTVPAAFGDKAIEAQRKTNFARKLNASGSSSLTDSERHHPAPRRGGILLLAGLGLWLITISLLWAGRNPSQMLGRRYVEADRR